MKTIRETLIALGRLGRLGSLRTLGGLIMALLLTACYGGEDHEADTDIQQITTVGGISDATYTLYQGDTLRLQAKLAYSAGADTTRYDCRWLIGRSEQIGTGLKLEWPVRLPNGYSMASDIPGVFVARDRDNGLEFRQTFTIQVLSNYSPSAVVVYETLDHRLEWMSLQGEPQQFTRWFDGMVERINPGETITGEYRGALYNINEMAIFTDHAPDYGRCVSMVNADPDNGQLFNVGEFTGDVYGHVYHGAASQLNISNVVFGYGASKYLICNDLLHVFNGLDRKLPAFDEQTFVKSRGVAQAMSSKQFQRYKKCTFVRHDDGTIGAYHIYSDVMERLSIDGQPFVLDSLCGCFTEATGLSSNRPYDIYLVGCRAGQYAIYQFHVDYIDRVVQPLEFVRKIPVDATVASNVKYWWGSFAETYAFYSIDNKVYRFDYYEMTAFDASKAKLVAEFGEDEEIVDVFPLTTGLGLRDEDDCTVILLYNRTLQTSSLYVCETFNAKLIRRYDGIVPGRALFFSKCF